MNGKRRSWKASPLIRLGRLTALGRVCAGDPSGAQAVLNAGTGVGVFVIEEGGCGALARTVKAGDSRAVLLEDAALRIDARAANDTRSLLLEKCQSLGLARSDVPVKALLDSFLYYLVGVNIDRSHRRGAFDYMRRPLKA